MYAVWEPGLPTDRRSEWDAGVLAEPRVAQFWDQERVTARWLAQFRSDRSVLHTDAFLLFGPEARWEGTTPGPLVAAGGNIIGRSAELKDKITPLL